MADDFLAELNLASITERHKDREGIRELFYLKFHFITRKKDVTYLKLIGIKCSTYSEILSSVEIFTVFVLISGGAEREIEALFVEFKNKKEDY